MSTVTAKQLIDELARCVTCGREHKPARGSKGYAASDGHSYHTRMLDLFGYSSVNHIAKLRELAGSMR